MAKIELDLNPVERITTDAIGKPGSRVFYLQANQGDQVITLLVEKIQIQSLAMGVEQFLTELTHKYPNLTDDILDVKEEIMHIIPPVDPLFRVGEIGLGYDDEHDQVILVAREISGEDDKPEEMGVVRFWCTRSQLRALCQWGIEVTNQGRPICPQCGQPMDPEGHFCPKKNGHKH